MADLSWNGLGSTYNTVNLDLQGEPQFTFLAYALLSTHMIKSCILTRDLTDLPSEPPKLCQRKPQSVATIRLDRVFLSKLFIAWLWIKLPYDFCELYEDLFFHYLDKRSRTWKYPIPTTTNKVSMQQGLAYSSPSPDRPRAILPLPTNCWDSETVPPCSVHTYFSTPPSSFTLRISIIYLLINSFVV